MKYMLLYFAGIGMLMSQDEKTEKLDGYVIGNLNSGTVDVANCINVQIEPKQEDEGTITIKATSSCTEKYSTVTIRFKFYDVAGFRIDNDSAPGVVLDDVSGGEKFKRVIVVPEKVERATVRSVRAYKGDESF